MSSFPATILLAEDSQADAMLILRGFRNLTTPFSLKIVHDGAQVIQYLKGEENYADRAEFPIPALILLDLRMPRVDGFEVLQWMQKQPQFCKLPVIAIAGSLAPELITKVCQAGASCVLSKTADLSKFAQELNSLIETYLPSYSMPNKIFSHHSSNGTSPPGPPSA